MRFSKFAFAAAIGVLAACGGASSNQANNHQASHPAATMMHKAANKPGLMAVMHERHEGMETIGKANKVLHREIDARSPNLAAIRASARTIAGLSIKASGWFPRGTGPELGKTGARPEIWQNAQDFAAKLRDFQAEAKAFNAAAAGSDLGLIDAQYSDLSQACKACHDKYRSEMHH